MGFTVPAVHYSALATLPPELTNSKSQHSIEDKASVRFKLNQIFKKFLTNDQQMIPTKMEGRTQLSDSTDDEDHPAMVMKNPSNNNSGNRTFTEQKAERSASSAVESLERLPFSESYFSTTSKHEPNPFELSTYHKHCIRQEKYVDQKQFHPQSTSIHSDSTNDRSQKLTNQQDQMKFNEKTFATLPKQLSIEDQIGFKYASQRNISSTNRSSYAQQQTQHLRRLHSKSRIRPICNEPKTSSSLSVSSSIAHRIELLKQAMHNHQLEVHLPKSSSSSIIDPIHKYTQTNDSQSKSSEIHHIHHHHIYPSTMPWRTYLSIFGTIALLFLLLFQFITISF